MAIKKRSTKRSIKKKAAKTTPKAEVEDRVVFAFRLSKEERDLIHKAAGPRGASRFVLEAALAAAAKK